MMFNGSKFVTDNWNYITRFFDKRLTMLLTPAQIKPKSFESKRNVFVFFVCLFVFLPAAGTSETKTCVLGCYVASTVVLVKPFGGR